MRYPSLQPGDHIEEGSTCEKCGYEEILITEPDTGGTYERNENEVEEVEVQDEDGDDTSMYLCWNCRHKAGLVS